MCAGREFGFAAQRAEDLGFLAAHDLGDAGVIGAGQARHQFHLRPVEADIDQGGGEFGGAGRAGQVGCLTPALAAADHAGEQHTVFAGGEPGTDLLPQGVAEAAVGDVEDALGGVAAFADFAVTRYAERAETGGAPIDSDHCVVLPPWSCVASYQHLAMRLTLSWPG